MFPSRISALLAIPLLGLSACHSSRKTVSSYSVMDTITVSARNNPMDIFRTASPRIWDIVRTTATIRPDWSAREADGEVTLDVRPVLEPQDTLVLDAKDMIIHSVRGMGSGDSPLPYAYDSSTLRIAMNSHKWNGKGASLPAWRFPIRITYRARPYASRSGGSAAIKEDRGLYFVNTDGATPGKPRQIWTQGETESNSNWLPTIDKPNQRSRITLSIEVPDTMQSLGNGRFMGSRPSKPGFRFDTWQTDTAIQVYATMFAIGRFDKTVETWRHPSGKDLEVAYYTEPAYRRYAKNMFRNTPEMIGFFSNVTGVPYPWEKYSQIVVRDYVSGAMENTSASLFGEFQNQNDRQLIDATTEDIVSHELFHQWFGDYATMESWSNLTVSESFATYGEVLWRNHKYGQDNAGELAYEDKQRYLNAAERLDPPLVRFHYRDKEEMFDRISYQKGGSILRYIHGQIGDSAFYRAMRYYLTENALKSTEATHWRLALEKATGTDWTQFFNEWYYRGGHPELLATHSYDDAAQKLTIRIRQRNKPDSAKLYTLPLQFVVLNQADTSALPAVGSGTQAWSDRSGIRTVSRRQEDFVFPYQNGKRPEVLIDPYHELPGIIEEKKPMSAWLAQVQDPRSGYGARRAALNAALRQPKDPDAIRVYRSGIKSPDPGTRLHALNMLGTVTDPSWQESLRPEVAYILNNETRSKPLAAAFKVAGNWGFRNERRLMQEAVWDSSYFVAGAALTALSKVARDTAYVLAKQLAATQPRSALADAVWQIIGKHGERQDWGLLERYSAGLYGGERIRMTQRMSYFASETADDNLYRESIARIAAEARQEQEPTARGSVASLIVRLRRYYDIEAQKGGKSAEVAKRRAAWAKEQEAELMRMETDETVRERLEQAARGGE